MPRLDIVGGGYPHKNISSQRHFNAFARQDSAIRVKEKGYLITGRTLDGEFRLTPKLLVTFTLQH
jgi:hypothetical protein